jgi:internalin A
MKNDFITITLSNGEEQMFDLYLNKMELKDNPLIENLEAFIPLQYLEYITISNCEKLSDLGALVFFKKLRKLTIENCNSVTDLSPINNISSLRMLKCTFQNLETLKTLKDNLNLKALALSESNSISRFDLRHYDFLLVKFISPKIIDLSSIESLFQITNLEILFSNYLDTIKSITKLKNLEYVRLKNCTELSDISPLKDLTLLKELELTNQRDKFRNIEHAFEIKSLEVLSVDSCSGIEKIKIKNNNFSLKSLMISECLNLTRINEIYKLKSLYKLQIESCNNLEDFSVVKRLSTLQELILLKNLKFNGSF